MGAKEQVPVDELEGRELDAAVAEEVMDLNAFKVEGVWTVESVGPVASPPQILPPYSTYIAAAWQVLQHLWDEYGFEASATPDGPKGAACVIEDRSTVGQPLLERADTAPEAIARAALKAVRSSD